MIFGWADAMRRHFAGNSAGSDIYPRSKTRKSCKILRSRDIFQPGNIHTAGPGRKIIIDNVAHAPIVDLLKRGIGPRLKGT